MSTIPPFSRRSAATGPGRRAFTLLETLVTIVVLSILVALAVLVLGSAREKSYRAAMQYDLRSFVTARALHIAEAPDGRAESVAEVEGFNFSSHIHELAYSNAGVSDWSLTVGHNHTSTACTLSLSASGSQPIECFEFVPNDPPIASFEVSSTPTVPGEALTFTSTSTDPDGDPLVARWDFGGVASAEGDVVTHVAPSTSFTVTLTVTDPRGSTAVESSDIPVITSVLPRAFGLGWMQQGTVERSENMAVFTPGVWPPRLQFEGIPRYLPAVEIAVSCVTLSGEWQSLGFNAYVEGTNEVRYRFLAEVRAPEESLYGRGLRAFVWDRPGWPLSHLYIEPWTCDGSTGPAHSAPIEFRNVGLEVVSS